VPTISSWLDILELTGQVVLVPPYFVNFGKRLVKSTPMRSGSRPFPRITETRSTGYSSRRPPSNGFQSSPPTPPSTGTTSS
jgi:hypothetical protein